MKQAIMPVCFGLLAAFVVWFIFSATLSQEKARTGNCDKTFGFERVFAGDWFCPVEGK